jgi:hypothetical protein
MIQVLLVDSKKVFVVAEEVRNVADPLSSQLNHSRDPIFHFFGLLELEIYILRSKSD